jgi:predicted transcriptional regulator
LISEIDVLFAKFIENHINTQLGSDTMQKVKDRLAEKGYSLTQAVREFDIFDKTLREFFGKGADGMLQKIFNAVFEMKKDKAGNYRSFLIKDKGLINLILLTYSNQEKKAILETVAESALSISDILSKVNLSQSTGYRIISSLIKQGLLTETEPQEISAEGRKVSTYKSTISLLDIKIKKSTIDMEVHFAHEIVKNSRIMAAIMHAATKLRI